MEIQCRLLGLVPELSMLYDIINNKSFKILIKLFFVYFFIEYFVYKNNY